MVGKNKSPDQNKCGPDFRSNNKEIGLSDYVKTKTKNVDSLKLAILKILHIQIKVLLK